MEFVVYLEQLLGKSIPALPAPPSDLLSRSLACRLWNVCIQVHAQLTALSPPPPTLLQDLCVLRSYCCSCLELHLPAEEMMRYWARTGKAYLDCQDMEAAAFHLQKAEQCGKEGANPPPESWFHLYKWSLELCVKRNGETGNYIQLLCDLLASLPGERLSLCYFLYKDVAYPLSEKNLLAQAIAALNACLSLASDTPRRTEQVTISARSLLCSLYLDLQAYSLASELLQQLPENAASLALRVKLLIKTEDMSAFSDLIEVIVEQGPECVHTISDLLLSSSQLMDACRLLWTATQRFQQSDLVTKWAKALFSLVTMEPSLSETADYLSTSKALEAVCSFGTCEAVLPFLWNLAVERSHAEDFQGSSSILRKIAGTTQDEEMKQNALVLLAQNEFQQGHFESALESLTQTTQNDGKPALLRLHTLLRMQAASRDSVMRTFACLRTSEEIITAVSIVLQEKETQQDWSAVQSLVSAQLVKVLQSECTDSRLPKVVKFAVQTLSSTELVLECLQACALWPGLGEEDREWLHKKAWNLAIALPPGLLAYNLLQAAERLATTVEAKQRCQLTACHVCFAGGPGVKHQEALAALRKLQPVASLQSLHREMEFEGLLVTAPGSMAEYLERTCLSAQELKTAAGAAHRLKRPDITAMCLKQLLHVNCQSEVAETAAVLRTLVCLAASSDESFCYVEQAVKVASERTYPKDELDWLVAECWNSGVKNYRLDKLILAERWMSLALRLVEKNESVHSEQMRKVYSEVMRQRYGS